MASYNKKPNKTMVKSLAKKGQASMKGLQDINGNKFEANISYNIGPDKILKLKIDAKK